MAKSSKPAPKVSKKSKPAATSRNNPPKVAAKKPTIKAASKSILPKGKVPIKSTTAQVPASPPAKPQRKQLPARPPVKTAAPTLPVKAAPAAETKAAIKAAPKPEKKAPVLPRTVTSSPSPQVTRDSRLPSVMDQVRGIFRRSPTVTPPPVSRK